MWCRWTVYRIYCALFNGLYFNLISQVHRERHGWDLNRWCRWRVYRMTTLCVWENRNVWRRKRSTLSWLEYSIRSVRGNWHWRECVREDACFIGQDCASPEQHATAITRVTHICNNNTPVQQQQKQRTCTTTTGSRDYRLILCFRLF